MSMINTAELVETISELKNAASIAMKNQCADGFESLEKYLNEVEGFVRELQQSLWATEAKETIHRLEKGESLTQADQKLLRIFLVSDAEAYLKHENNFQDWVNELERIVSQLSTNVTQLNRENIADFRGVLKDAIRLVPDIRNYLDEQRRVEKFEQALNHMDQNSRKMLIKLLHDQLHCERR